MGAISTISEIAAALASSTALAEPLLAGQPGVLLAQNAADDEIPGIGMEGRIGDPDIAPEGNMGRPGVPSEGDFGTSGIAPEGNIGTSEIAPGGNLGTPGIAPEGNVGSPGIGTREQGAE